MAQIPLKTLSNADHAHQNPAIRHYSTIFRHIQNLVQNLHMQKLGILGILQYSELFHNCITTRIFRALSYLRKFTNVQNSDIFKTRQIQHSLKDIGLRWSFFAKIVKNYNYCCKVLLSFIVSSDRHIHGLFRYIQPYCGTFRTLCNSCIFTTLPYLEPKTYSELCQGIFWHIQKAV